MLPRFCIDIQDDRTADLLFVDLIKYKASFLTAKTVLLASDSGVYILYVPHTDFENLKIYSGAILALQMNTKRAIFSEEEKVMKIFL